MCGDDGRGFQLPASLGDLARIGKLSLAGMEERRVCFHELVEVKVEGAGFNVEGVTKGAIAGRALVVDESQDLTAEGVA